MSRPPHGSLVRRFDTGAVSSTLTLPPATVSMEELGVIPVSATAALVQNGPATGTANLTTNTTAAASPPPCSTCSFPARATPST